MSRAPARSVEDGCETAHKGCAAPERRSRSSHFGGSEGNRPIGQNIIETLGSNCIQEGQPIQLDERSASAREEAMRGLVFALALLGAAATSARAQDAIPDLKGTWSGKRSEERR